MPLPPQPARIWVKPVHILAKIPDLDHQDSIPAEGREVNDSVHWRRHENLRDVKIFASEKEAAAFTPDDGDPSPDIPSPEAPAEEAAPAAAAAPVDAAPASGGRSK